MALITMPPLGGMLDAPVAAWFGRVFLALIVAYVFSIVVERPSHIMARALGSAIEGRTRRLMRLGGGTGDTYST